MRYYEIIKEGYKEVQQKYITAGIDPENIEKTFNTYKELVNRNQVSGNERNIDWWGKQSFDQFKAFVDEKSSKHSTTQIKRSKIPGKSINLVDNDNWHIVIPLDKDSSCFHGKNSDWCTTKRDEYEFEEYFYDDEDILIYCKNIKTGGMWAISVHKNTDLEIFDQNDKSMDADDFNSQTGLDVYAIVTAALHHQQEISSSRDAYKETVEKDQLDDVTQNGLNIEYIKNPSEQVQLAAVTENGYAIEYIIEKGIIPSEQVQLAAVAENADSIQYIKNPSEKFQLAAVTQYWDQIKNEDNESDFDLSTFRDIIKNTKIQLAAVTRDGTFINFIILNDIIPSEQVQLAAVTQYADSLFYITNAGIKPSEQVQLAAIRKNPEAIEYIKNPSKAVKKAAGVI